LLLSFDNRFQFKPALICLRDQKAMFVAKWYLVTEWESPARDVLAVRQVLLKEQDHKIEMRHSLGDDWDSGAGIRSIGS
jgi:hypothetical protein